MAQASKYLDSGGQEEARGRYVEIAQGVGWTDEGMDEEEENALSDLSDEETPRRAKGKGKASGMGVSVSVMTQEDSAKGDEGYVS